MNYHYAAFIVQLFCSSSRSDLDSIYHFNQSIFYCTAINAFAFSHLSHSSLHTLDVRSIFHLIIDSEIFIPLVSRFATIAADRPVDGFPIAKT